MQAAGGAVRSAAQQFPEPWPHDVTFNNNKNTWILFMWRVFDERVCPVAAGVQLYRGGAGGIESLMQRLVHGPGRSATCCLMPKALA